METGSKCKSQTPRKCRIWEQPPARTHPQPRGHPPPGLHPTSPPTPPHPQPCRTHASLAPQLSPSMSPPATFSVLTDSVSLVGMLTAGWSQGRRARCRGGGERGISARLGGGGWGRGCCRRQGGPGHPRGCDVLDPHTGCSSAAKDTVRGTGQEAPKTPSPPLPQLHALGKLTQACPQCTLLAIKKSFFFF